MCMRDVGEGGLSRCEVNSLSGIYSAPPLDVAYYLALTGAVYCSSQWIAKSSCFSHASTVNTLTLLIKVSATVTVYRDHSRTFAQRLDLFT